MGVFMRILVLAALALLTIVPSFARDIELNGSEIQVGALAQTDFQPAHEVLNIIRTSDSPEDITLLYSVGVQETVCVDWENRPFWVEGRWERVCYVQHNQQICNDVYRPGYYEYRQVCVKTEEVMTKDTKKLYLNFKKAENLEGNAREVFALEFNQKQARNDNHTIQVNKVEGAQDYDVKETTILGLKRTLKFIAK